LIKLAGTIISNGPASIGDINTSVQLMGDAIINTSGASSATNRALSIGGSTTGAGYGLTLISGNGVTTTGALGDLGAGLGRLALLRTNIIRRRMSMVNQHSLSSLQQAVRQCCWVAQIMLMVRLI
jgi:hypothetical protein